MYSFDKPTFNQKKVIEDCLPIRKISASEESGTTGLERRERIIGYIPEVCEAEKNYNKYFEERAKNHPARMNVPRTKIIARDMEYLYDRFSSDSARKNMPIDYYSLLTSVADYCPYCGRILGSDSAQLDHFLPKSLYPILAVTPENLVPCCGKCNNMKSNKDYTATPVIHPYYDSFDKEVWIKASVIQSVNDSTIGFYFYIDCPEEWPVMKKKIVENHFKIYRLDERYATWAAGFFRDYKKSIERNYRTGGKNDVRRRMQEKIDEENDRHPNYYEAVVLRALYSDKWFWNVYLEREFRKISVC